MGKLIDSLPVNIIESLKSNTLSFNNIVQFTVAIRSKVNTFKTIPNARMFWKLCAINELHELTAEFPWIVWKKPFAINYHKAQLEAIDVLTLVIGALTTESTITINEKYEKFIDIEHDYFGSFRQENFVDDVDSIIDLINSIVRSINYFGEQDQVKLINIFKKLCSITMMNYQEFCTYLIAKLTLVFCRIDQESGTYHSDWNKISSNGWSECDILEQLISNYNSNASYNLYDLALVVEEAGADFRY